MNFQVIFIMILFFGTAVGVGHLAGIVKRKIDRRRVEHDK